MDSKVIFAGAAALLCCGGSAAAQTAVTADWADSATVRVAVGLTDGIGFGADYAVCATPALVRGGDTLRLGTAVFRSPRNSRHTERGRHFGTTPPPSGCEASAGDTLRLERVLARADAPWLWDGPVEVVALREREGCCSVKPLPARRLGAVCHIPPFTPAVPPVEDNTGKAGELRRDNPVLEHISAYRPYDDTRILRKERGALYVHFPLDASELRHEFRSNAAVLDRITGITRSIMSDTTSSVRRIQIIGLASVEGPLPRNRRLAAERAAALKSYIQARVPTPDSLYECVGGGEAWTELRSQIEDTDFPGRDALLAVISSEPDPSRRERRMKSLDGGRPYAYLRDNVLGDQRNSGYIRIYYDYVPDEAARAINRAAGLLRDGRHAEALSLLRSVEDDSRAQNALGAALYMSGDEAGAAERFRRAAAAGDGTARRNLQLMEENSRRRAALREAEARRDAAEPATYRISTNN